MIEVEVTEEKKQEEVLDFPCLMKSEDTGVIILATRMWGDRNIEGTVIDEGINNAHNSVGYFYTSWNSTTFKLLPKGTEVKLKND
jgi:hypothetical protein